MVVLAKIGLCDMQVAIVLQRLWTRNFEKIHQHLKFANPLLLKNVTLIDRYRYTDIHQIVLKHKYVKIATINEDIVCNLNFQRFIQILVTNL